MTEMMRTTNLGDTAIIRPALSSIEQGRVDMISTRGINVITPWGPKFVKWFNVMEIRKEL